MDIEPKPEEEEKLINFSLNIENNFEKNAEDKLGSILTQQTSNEATKEMLKAEFTEFLYDYEVNEENRDGANTSERDLKKAPKLLVEDQRPNEVETGNHENNEFCT